MADEVTGQVCAHAATVVQCKTCPWRTTCDPTRDIPGGYSVALHEGLAGTIKSGLASIFDREGRVMACHYSTPGAMLPCAGWLHNQIGAGNNFGVRLAVAAGRLPVPKVSGEQHETFEETLPRSSSTATSSPATCRSRLSARQLEVLRLLARELHPVEWSQIWDSYSWADVDSPLAMTNFDRVTDALMRRGLVAYDADHLVVITDAGRQALAARS